MLARALFLGAYSLSVSYYFYPVSLGDSPRYNYGFKLIEAARIQCKKQPGLLLANRNWGNYLRYQAQCPILSNNFILTQKEVDYVKLTYNLLQQTPGQLRVLVPDVRYVLVSEMDLSPLTESLLSGDTFEGFSVVGEIRYNEGKIRGRLYRVDPLVKPPFIIDEPDR